MANDEVDIRHQGPGTLVHLVLISNLEFLVAEAMGVLYIWICSKLASLCITPCYCVTFLWSMDDST